MEIHSFPPEDNLVSREIDGHFQRFGKEPWEVDYDLVGYCELCNSRIDEFGYCGCGGSAD